jgi:hypothetical protein
MDDALDAIEAGATADSIESDTLDLYTGRTMPVREFLSDGAVIVSR